MYGKWLYKEIGTEYGACMVEIYRKNYTGASIEIGALAADSLSIALENLGSITDPIGKSVCSFSIIDTNQVEYDDFFTPDATALKVVVSTRVGSGAYATRWSGYVTPDFFAENLSYRTPISISARDNIGYLNDVDFDLTATTITVRELIQSAFKRIAEDYPMSLSFVSQKQTAEGILAIDATISTTLLREMSWGEALETILHDLGLQMRWVDNNTIAVLDLSQIPEYYATQGFNFIGASGYREIVPAWRQLAQEQDYGLKEDFFEGEITSQNVKFVKEETVDYSLPPALDGSPQQVRFKYYQPTNWLSQGEIYTLNPADYNFGTLIQENNNELFKDRIYFTGIAADSTDYANHYIGWRQTVYKSNWPLNIKFKAFNAVMYSSSWLINNLYPIILYESNPNPDSYQVGLKVNILLHTGTLTYILKEDWVLLSGAETDAITFILPEIKWSELGKEEDLTISINQIPYDGELEFRIYGHFKNPKHDSNVAISDEAFTKMVTYIKDVVYTYESSSIPTGQDSGVLVNEQHNIKDDQDYTFGQVPNDCGGINAFVGGLYKANGDELIGFQRNADATNYNLLELVGREIIHFNKRNYNRLSGTIKNLDKEPLMFNRLFVREGKKYAPYNYSLNVISNEMNITSMQEVELYTTANFSEVHSEVSTGGSTVSSGNNQILQYSAEVGNAKRLYELQTISENEKPDVYVLVDGAGYPEARKLKLTDIAGLDEKALEQYLVQYKYLQEADLTPIIQDFEKLEEAVNPLFGYFDATGNANNALKLGGHSADYFASAKAVNTLTTDLNSLASRVSINEQGITTNKTNIATLTTDLGKLTGRVDKLEGYWYIDDDGNLHTTYNIVVDGGGAFGKGSGGGGDVPSGGGIDETQLWNILGQSGTQTIHSSHIPDLSGKYLSVSGGTINGGIGALSIKRNSSNSASIVKFENSDGVMGYLGISNSNLPIWYNKDLTDFGYLIHSSNIGSYNAGSATKLQDNTAFTAWGQTFFKNGVPKSVNGALYDINGNEFLYASGTLVRIGSGTTGAGQNTFLDGNNIYLRYGASYGIGLFLNYYGNVLIGTTSDNGYKFQVSGTSLLSAYKASTQQPTLGNKGDGTYLCVGDKNFGLQIWSSGDGSSSLQAHRFDGTAAAYSLKLSPLGGNVLIGTTSDSGYKLAVNGTFNATTIYQNGTSIGSLAFKNSLVASDIPSLDWSKITSGKPTTLSGYGITDAVSTSGGTINGDLIINSSSDASKALAFKYGDKGFLYLYRDTNDLHILIPSGQRYKILNSNNIGSYALPLSGGTINAASWKALVLDNSVKPTDGIALQLSISNTNKGGITYNGEAILLYNATSAQYLSIKDDGTPTYNGNTLIHSRNIGSYNAGSATKLQDNTAFTAWGQIFFNDGKPQNVSGKLTSVSYFRFYDANATSPGIYGGTHFSSSLTANDLAIYASSKIVIDGGNVLIGTTDDSGYKLAVNGATLFNAYKSPTQQPSLGNKAYGTHTIIGSENFGLQIWSNNDGSTKMQVHRFDGTATAYNMIIQPLGGNVIIGTTSNNGSKLQVAGAISLDNVVLANTSSALLVQTPSGASWFGMMNNSFCHIYTNAPAFYMNKQLYVDGNLTVSGGGAFGSDIRYKDITSYRQIDLETIVKAPLFSFKWTDREDKVEHLGTSAQYWLETQAKDAVNITNPKFFHLDYGALAVGIGISVAREVKGVKTEVQTLKEELSQVKKELKYYKELWQHSGHILHQHS